MIYCLFDLYNYFEQLIFLLSIVGAKIIAISIYSEDIYFHLSMVYKTKIVFIEEKDKGLASCSKRWWVLYKNQEELKNWSSSYWGGNMIPLNSSNSDPYFSITGSERKGNNWQSYVYDFWLKGRKPKFFEGIIKFY